MKKTSVLVTAFLAMWSVGAMASGIGVVDMKTIFSTSPKVKAIKDQLSKQFEPQKNKLQTMGQALQADIGKYQKNKAVMNQKDLSALQTTITNEETAFRAAQAKFQQDVYAAQNNSLNEFMTAVKAAVKIVAEKDKLDLVIPSNDVLYTSGDKDITKDVLKEIK